MEQKKSTKGFASMHPQRQREVASLGGKMAHKLGVAHKWTQEEGKKVITDYWKRIKSGK